MSAQAKHIEEIDYSAYSGIPDSEENNLLGIPEVKVVVGYYKYRIQEINNTKGLSDFLKKMKLSKLVTEYASITRAIKDVNIRLQILARAGDNLQAQEDIRVLGQQMALCCFHAMDKYNIKSPRSGSTNMEPEFDSNPESEDVEVDVDDQTESDSVS